LALEQAETCIPPKILPALKNGLFMRAFLRKGKLSNLLSRIPVHVILNSRTALLGAAQYGIDLRMTGENS